jgi:mono/diheme cytochrome c family protein
MRSKVFILVLLLFVAGAVALFLWFRSHGFSARAEPSWIEAKLARHARRIATPANAKETKNPFPVTDASLTEAREHYVEHCSLCHGIDGRGQTVIGRNLYPKVPPMTDADTQQLTDGELFYIISNGVRFTGMPAWSSEDSPESIWALVSFIRKLPTLSPEEIKRMQEMAAGADEHSMAEDDTPATENQKSTQGEERKAGRVTQSKRKPAKPQSHSH